MVPKYAAFLQAFPTVQALAAADLAAVLGVWSGLGYNRRAKFLWQAAQTVVNEFDGRVPDDTGRLQRLPGIGPNTAGAIAAYAFNQPVTFIETNIRSVYLHHFFADRSGVPDGEIMPLIARSLDGLSDIRTWYYALMDYGTHLKSTLPNPGRRSRHHARQSPFHGSRRQLRGRILRLLGAGPLTPEELTARLADQRAADICDVLTREGLITRRGGVYRLG